MKKGLKNARKAQRGKPKEKRKSVGPAWGQRGASVGWSVEGVLRADALTTADVAIMIGSGNN